MPTGCEGGDCRPGLDIGVDYVVDTGGGGEKAMGAVNDPVRATGAVPNPVR